MLSSKMKQIVHHIGLMHLNDTMKECYYLKIGYVQIFYFLEINQNSFLTVNGLQDKLVYLDGKWLSEYTICIASLPKKWKEKLKYNN